MAKSPENTQHTDPHPASAPQPPQGHPSPPPPEPEPAKPEEHEISAATAAEQKAGREALSARTKAPAPAAEHGKAHDDTHPSTEHGKK